MKNLTAFRYRFPHYSLMGYGKGIHIIQKKHRKLFAAALVFVISAVSLSFPITVSAQNSLSSVGSNYMGDWASITQTTASGSYSTGPHRQILGQGSYEIRTGYGKDGVGGMVFLINNSYAGTNLGDLQQLEYSTYTDSPMAGTDVVPRFVISAEINGQRTSLIYINPPQSHSELTVSKWVTWPVLDGTWFSTDDLPDIEGNTVVHAYQPIEWSKIVSLDTRGSIAPEGIRIEAGQRHVDHAWSQYVGYIDKVVVNDMVYDFEPNSRPGSVTILNGPSGKVAVLSSELAAEVTVMPNQSTTQRVFTSQAAYLASQYEINFSVPEITSEQLVAASIKQPDIAATMAREIREKVRDKLKDNCQFGGYWDDDEWEKCDDKKKKDKDKDKDKKRRNRS